MQQQRMTITTVDHVDASLNIVWTEKNVNGKRGKKKRMKMRENDANMKNIGRRVAKSQQIKVEEEWEK